MKKYIIIFISIFILSFCGCNKPETPPKNQEINIQKEEEDKKIKHEPRDAVDTEGYKKLNEYSYDFDSDGEDDLLEVFSTVFYEEDDEPHYDDGANWIITVTTASGVYKLYDGYIQLGKAELDIGEIYNETPEKLIILTQTTGAGKSVVHYIFSDGVFYEEIVYTTDSYSKGGVNIIETIE